MSLGHAGTSELVEERLRHGHIGENLTEDSGCGGCIGGLGEFEAVEGKLGLKLSQLKTGGTQQQVLTHSTMSSAQRSRRLIRLVSCGAAKRYITCYHKINKSQVKIQGKIGFTEVNKFQISWKKILYLVY